MVRKNVILKIRNLEDTPQRTLSNLNCKNYRCYFIYIISFVEVFATILANLALTNILVFKLDFNTNQLGLTFTLFSFSYIIGPFLLKKVLRILKLKKSLTLISILQLINWLIVLINKKYVFIFEIFDGIILSNFWILINTFISLYEKENQVLSNKDENPFKNFSISWNVGGILSQLTGIFITFLIHNKNIDEIILTLSVSLLILQVILSTRVYISTENSYLKNKKSMKKFKNHSKKNRNYKENNTKSLIFLIISITVLGELAYQISKSIFNISFPFSILNYGKSSNLIYLFTLLQQTLLLSVILIGSKYGSIKLYRLFYIGISGVLLESFLMIVSNSFTIDSIVFITIGLFAGLLYTYSYKLLIKINNEFNIHYENESINYSTIYEICSGFGFGIIPLMISIIPTNNFMDIFKILFLISLSLLVYFQIATIVLLNWNIFGFKGSSMNLFNENQIETYLIKNISKNLDGILKENINYPHLNKIEFININSLKNDKFQHLLEQSSCSIP